jgi:hypothetical protein
VSTIPAKEIERKRDGSHGRDHVHVVPANHTPKAIFHPFAKCDGGQAAGTDHHLPKTHRRQECATVFNIDATA